MPRGKRGEVTKCTIDGCSKFVRYYGKYCQSHAVQLFPEVREKYREAQKRYREKLIKLCYKAYGGYKCSCPGCTEVNPGFLSLDHIHGDGNKHRKEIKSVNGMSIFEWLVKNDLPEGVVQVLCFNCNLGKSRNGGICPHLDSGDSK